MHIFIACLGKSDKRVKKDTSLNTEPFLFLLIQHLIDLSQGNV